MVVLSATTLTLAAVTFTLTDNATHPGFARELDVTIAFTAGTGGTSSNAFVVTHADLVDVTTGSVLCSVARGCVSSTQFFENQMTVNFSFPWPSAYAHGIYAAQRTLVVNFFSSGFSTPTTAVLYLNSWNTF